MVLPTGLDVIYRRYLERELVRAREKWEARYRPLLAVSFYMIADARFLPPSSSV
jgi:hypothetical protein